VDQPEMITQLGLEAEGIRARVLGLDTFVGSLGLEPRTNRL
jgi:hypothetical protein